MIEPRDLLELADRLALIGREVEGRAAVSRAYYGAFHIAKHLLEAGCGIILPGGPEVHRKLQFCLEHAGDLRFLELGRRLEMLREQRNRADYSLVDGKFASQANVHAQIDAAKDIAMMVAEVEAQLASVRSAVRTYASDVLKLRLKSI